MIDVNVWLGQWPLRRVWGDRPEQLLETLQAGGVTEAWAASFDGLLHRDIAAVNARTAEDCGASGERLVPIGSINPMLPDWKEDLRRCHEVHRMPGIRLLPNYHGYRLDEPPLAELVEQAQRRGMFLQVVARMDDPRVQHRLLQVADVDLAPLPAIVARSQARFVVLNAQPTAKEPLLKALVATQRVWLDIAMLEQVGGLERAVAVFGAKRLLFGSHAPLFVFQSAALKLRESVLAAADESLVRRENAALLRRDRGGDL